MSKQILIDVSTINAEHLSYESADSIREYLKGYEIIDVETLPIVQEQRTQIASLCEFLSYATNGKLSNSNHTVEEMKTAFDDCVKLECDDCSMASEIRELREKLTKYEQAEQEGRLIELPCKIGASVKGKNENWHGTVDEISVNSEGVFLFVNSGYSGYEKPEDVVFCEKES